MSRPLPEPLGPVARVVAARLYDGAGVQALSDRTVEIAGGRIVAVRPATAADRRGAVEAEVAAPGFIDMQINGAADALFNAAPNPATLARIAQGARAGGTAHLLPTFVTAPGEAWRAARAAAAQALAEGVAGVLGLHLEGPFLSPERAGVHPAAAMRPLADADVAALCAPFPGVLLLTLAPERAPPGAVARLAAAGLRVFAGHSAATAADIARAKAEGLAGVTHLWNAMSQLTAREPGVVGATLASGGLHAGIIADGFHVAWSNVALAARVLGDRLCLVSDAMPTLAGAADRFTLEGREIVLRDGRLTDAEGRLAGAQLPLDLAVRNMVAHAGATPAAALRMASGAPAAALGLAGELGRIAPGWRASLTLLDAGLRACAVVVDGVLHA